MGTNCYGTGRLNCLKVIIILIALIAWVGFSSIYFTPAAHAVAGDKDKPASKDMMARILKIQMPFIENQGQIADERVKFYLKTFGGTLYVTDSGEMIYSFSSSPGPKSHPKDRHLKPEPVKPESQKIWTLRETLLGISDTSLKGINKAGAKANYFIGNDPSKWKTDIATYDQLGLGEVYEGIDLRLKAHGKNFEKIFTVKPGFDPSVIKLKIEGANFLRINEKGELEAGTELGTLSFSKPFAYQELNGKRVEVKVAYNLEHSTIRNPKSEILSDSEVPNPNSELIYSFKVGGFEKSIPLIIDPVLVYSTYLGGGDTEAASGIVVDSLGNAYITGYTYSTGSPPFPTTTGVLQTSSGGVWDAFLTKINILGNALVYSTYIGGGADDFGNGIAIDSSGNAYVAGYTSSSTPSPFPTTTGAFQTALKGTTNAFITKINASGNALVYSTYLGGGGEDQGFGIAVDSLGNVYVTGRTSSSGASPFPTTTGAFQTSLAGNLDAFVTKINDTGNTLLYSTYLGGGAQDGGDGIAVDSSGNAYITGYTLSTDPSPFPTTPGAFQTSLAGNGDAFVTKIDASGNLVYSTYLGGDGDDSGYGIAVDSLGNAYVTGPTSSTGSKPFPTTSGAFQGALAGAVNAFIAKINASGNALVYSTYLGGGGTDNGAAIGVDISGNAYIVGTTSSTGSKPFPTTSDAFQTSLAGTYDAFVTKISAPGNALLYSTYLGGGGNDWGWGIAVDISGNAYVAGQTTSAGTSPFPTTPGAFQTSSGGGSADVFVAKIFHLEKLRFFELYVRNGALFYVFGLDTKYDDLLQSATLTGPGGFIYSVNLQNENDILRWTSECWNVGKFRRTVFGPMTNYQYGLYTLTLNFYDGSVETYSRNLTQVPITGVTSINVVINSDGSADVSWSPVLPNQYYWVAIRSTDGLTDGYYESDTVLGGSSMHIDASTLRCLEEGQTYQWQVRVLDEPRIHSQGTQLWTDNTQEIGTYLAAYAVDLSGKRVSWYRAEVRDNLLAVGFDIRPGSRDQMTQATLTFPNSSSTYQFDLTGDAFDLSTAANFDKGWWHTFTGGITYGEYQLRVDFLDGDSETYTKNIQSVSATPVSAGMNEQIYPDGAILFTWTNPTPPGPNQLYTMSLRSFDNQKEYYQLTRIPGNGVYLPSYSNVIIKALEHCKTYRWFIRASDYTSNTWVPADTPPVISANTEKTSTSITFFYNPFNFAYNTLTVTPSASGKVSSSPYGINCGSYCSDTFIAGEPLTLTATPNAGYELIGWTGCDSTTGNQCTLTMTTSNRGVTVSFGPAIPASKPAAPINGSPVGGGVNINPIFSWAGSTGADSYELQVSTDSGFGPGSIIFDRSGITGNSQAVNGLETGKGYFWRVSATNDSGTSDWSATWTFQVGGTCPTPAVALNPYPPDTFTGIPLTSQFLTWESSTGANSYDLYFGTSSNPPFVGNVIDTSYTLPALNPNTTYYWKIIAKNNCGHSTSGLLWSFTTVPGIPAPPVLISPAKGETAAALNPTLNWQASNGASSYWLQFSTKPSLSTDTNIIDHSIAGTSNPLTGLNNSTTYYWRVNASNTQGTSDWSDISTFITQPPYGDVFAGVRGITDPDNDHDGIDDNWEIANLSDISLNYKTLFVRPKMTNSILTEPSSYQYWDGFIKLFPDTLTRYNSVNRYGFANVPALLDAGIEVVVIGPTCCTDFTDPNNPKSCTSIPTYSGSGFQCHQYKPFDNFNYDPAADSNHPNCDILEITYVTDPLYGYCLECIQQYGGHTFFSTQGKVWSWDTKGYTPSTAGPYGYHTSEIYALPLNTYFSEGAYSNPIAAGSSSMGIDCSITNCNSKSPLNLNTTDYVNGLPGSTVQFNPITFDSTGKISSITPPLPVTGYDQNTVLRRTIVHEMGHALLAGLDTDHCVDPNCIMYQSVLDWQMHDFGHGACGHQPGGGKDIRVDGIIHNSLHGIVATPPAPALGTPANQATGIAINPTLTWNAATGATSYSLQVSTDPNFGTTVANQATITGTSYAVSGLLNSTKYYWRVNAANSGGTSAWSSAFSFTTVPPPPPAAPTLSSPANGATGISVTPSLIWNASTGATSYAVQVSTSSTTWSGTSLKIDQKGVTNPSYQASGFSASTKYYWRVNATGPGGTGAWSSVFSFTTAALPSVPNLSSPANNATGVTRPPTLTWNASTNATSYRLQVSTSSGFSSTVIDQSVTTTSYSATGLSANVKYYWRVNATGLGGTSAWSSVRNFTTK